MAPTVFASWDEEYDTPLGRAEDFCHGLQLLEKVTKPGQARQACPGDGRSSDRKKVFGRVKLDFRLRSTRLTLCQVGAILLEAARDVGKHFKETLSCWF